MAWVRSDDGEAHHPKILSVSLSAYGLFHASKGYASRHLTDGFVPRQALSALHPPTPRALALRCAQELVAAGLWEEREDGWMIHDYLEFNPSRAQVLDRQLDLRDAKVRAGQIGGRRSGEVRRSRGNEAAGKHPEADQKQVLQADWKQNEAPARPDPSPTASNEAETTVSSPATRPPVPLNGHPVREQAREVITFLNAKTGRSFRSVDANLRLVEARLRSVTVQQLKGVVAFKARQWLGDPKMAAYLRPATLFNATKFEQYLGEIPRVEDAP